MRTLLVDFVKFIFKQTSENAVYLMILLSDYLNIKDCEQMVEYLDAILDLKISQQAKEIKEVRNK